MFKNRLYLKLFPIVAPPKCPSVPQASEQQGQEQATSITCGRYKLKLMSILRRL